GAALLASSPTLSWALPPAGFVNQGIVAGLDQPTDLAFMPNGKLLVTTKPGQMWLVDPSADPVTIQAYMTVPNIHNSYAETGIMSIELDPSFATNGFFYLYYANATTSRF